MSKKKQTIKKALKEFYDVIFQKPKLLKYMNKVESLEQAFNFYNMLNETGIRDQDKAIALCKELKNDGFIQSFSTVNKHEISHIKLSYKGKMYIGFYILTILKATFKWIFDNIVEFTALVLSLIALLKN